MEKLITAIRRERKQCRAVQCSNSADGSTPTVRKRKRVRSSCRFPEKLAHDDPRWIHYRNMAYATEANIVAAMDELRQELKRMSGFCVDNDYPPYTYDIKQYSLQNLHVSDSSSSSSAF